MKALLRRFIRWCIHGRTPTPKVWRVGEPRPLDNVDRQLAERLSRPTRDAKGRFVKHV